MRPVLSVAEMKAADAAAGVAVEVLIRRAGRAVANEALAMLGGAYGRHVVVVAGKGNNGADGRAAARILAARGARVDVVPPGPGRLPAADLVIDAAFGTGLRGGYDAPDPGDAVVLAVDIPSGVDGDTGAVAGAVTASVTVSMAALKTGLLLGEGPARSGRVIVADIGLAVGAPQAHLVEDADLAWLPARGRDAHKWERAVFVVAGSPGMRGAAALCAAAAQRAGAGMVRLGSPGVSEHPAGEAVGVALPAEGWEPIVLGQLDRCRALIVGPGLASHDGVTALVGAAAIPTVVDATGLAALGTVDDVAALVKGRPDAPVILTPHDGEFARLTGEPPGADRLGAARRAAERSGAIVLLKGSTTIVAAPDGRVLLAARGDARLATAGTGDVLSGIIGAFCAAGLGGVEAAALAAHVHGAAAQKGRRVGLVAGDLPELVADVLSG